MRDLWLGHDAHTGQEVYLPKKALQTHAHLPGATGKGKTTAMLALLYQLLRDLRDPACHFVVDFLGGLSFELLMWMASPYCPAAVRERLVYICPGREGHVLGFNPLVYDTLAHAYYKCSRATELILRGWRSQDIEAMPRLARWCFNAFHAVQQLGLTIADASHLLFPGSELHRPLLRCLPDMLRHEWSELIDSRSAEVLRTLDSTRNRLHPFFHSDILRLMFSSTVNRADMHRFMRERRIVVLDLSNHNRISPQMADTFAGLFFNELLTTARSLPRTVRYQTYCWLDEFQRLVQGPDLEFAIPEVRQLGLSLILAHQSFAQLKQGETDLTWLIWQLQTRLAFGNYGPDAETLAEEFAALSFDPYRVKDELWSRRQLVTSHRIVDLASWSHTRNASEQWQKTYGRNWSNSQNYFQGIATSRSAGEGTSDADGHGWSSGTGETSGAHQSLVPVHEEFLELSRRTYFTHDETKHETARRIRELRRGQTLYQRAESSDIRTVNVRQSRPGPLSFSVDVIERRFPHYLEAYERLLEWNFAQTDLFVSPATIEAETQARLQRVLGQTIVLPATAQPPRAVAPPDSDAEADPFP